MNTSTSLPRQAFIYNGKINEGTASFEAHITEFLRRNRGNTRPLLLRMTSSGGVPEQIFGFCGLLRQVRAENHEVHIHILGQLCGFTYLLATLADKIIMEPTASLVFGQMKFSHSGTVVSIASHIDFQQKLFSKLVAAIVQRSKGKLDEATVRSWKARHFTPKMALELGLCDEVLYMPTKAVPRNYEKPEHHVHLNLSFSNESKVYDMQIALHNWLEDSANAGCTLRIFLTSWGGTVIQALSFYGLLCEAQRQGHHVIIQVLGEAYSCALWFATVALGSGTVLIDPYSMLMFHPPSTDLDCDLDDAPAKLSVEFGMYEQTRELLSKAPGFTAALMDAWEKGQDRYFTSDEVVGYGLGELFSHSPSPSTHSEVAA